MLAARPRWVWSASAALSLALAACGGDDTAPTDEAEPPSTTSPEKLTALGLFEDAVAQTPSEDVLPYDVNAVLYADEAEKLRFMSVPPGEAASYDALGFWDYPDGTVFIKTFFFYLDARDPELGRRLLETRIIRRDKGTWTGRTYLWNDAQTVATRHKVGKTLQVQWVDASGAERTQDYRVPNDNECKTCHSKSHRFEPLGPRTRQLNRTYDYDGVQQNQIERLVELGWVTGDISAAADRFTLAEPYGGETLERRARAYLDANCSHCHRPGGEAGSTALDLRAETSEPYSLGVCRSPVSAGPGSGDRDYDIVPGDPDASILAFRMESTDPELKMPELPTLTSDAQGTTLVRAWIASMTKSDCN
jgi:uncharacterized repeat protein (TIGR03806 family)